METRFRFSMSERRSGAAAVCEEDDEGAEAAPAPEASDAEEVSRELLELMNDKILDFRYVMSNYHTNLGVEDEFAD